MIKDEELLAARAIEDRLSEEAKSSRGSLFGDSVSDLMNDASYYLSLLLDELDGIKERQCFPHEDICNVLLDDLNSLEEAVYEIVDKKTIEKIVARKIEIKNENRMAKAVREGEGK